MSETHEVEARLAEADLVIPEVLPAAGKYIGAVQVGEILFLSGQGASWSPDKSEYYFGRMGADFGIDKGYRAARNSMLSLLALAKESLGTLDRIVRPIKVLGFIASAESFHQQPSVLNGASDVLLTAFGDEAGAHARSAIGVQSLPLGNVIEIEMTFQVRSDEQ
jgi:enamine deaminase RidA (YjgF/YER057c/UK114 family)